MVPIYKEITDITEQVSLRQLFYVLGGYDIVFVAPERLEGFCDAQGYVAVYFDNKYFKNTSTYSELLLSDIFYAKFSNYEYMLVYQLDAFVFRDELLEFCNLGYDYIGAPVPRNCCYEWRIIKARVGNGGFSLRKISSVRRVIVDFSNRCNEKYIKDMCHKYEDLFFSYCGAREDVDFSVPDVKTALKFAVDDDVSHSYQNLGINLPFGCHRWSKAERYQNWRPFVAMDEEMLSRLDTFFYDKSGFNYRYLQWESVAGYIIYRFTRYNSEKLRDFLYSKLDKNHSYIIWGYGNHGVVLHKLLKQFDYNLVQIFDINKKINEVDNTPVNVPNIDMLKHDASVVIIAATGYDKKIKDEMLCGGISDKKIIMFRDLSENIVSEYVVNFMMKIKS